MKCMTFLAGFVVLLLMAQPRLALRRILAGRANIVQPGGTLIAISHRWTSGKITPHHLA